MSAQKKSQELPNPLPGETLIEQLVRRKHAADLETHELEIASADWRPTFEMSLALRRSILLLPATNASDAGIQAAMLAADIENEIQDVVGGFERPEEADHQRLAKLVNELEERIKGVLGSIFLAMRPHIPYSSAYGLAPQETAFFVQHTAGAERLCAAARAVRHER